MESFWQDVRYALRMLRRAPGFTFIAVLTLALGIGATTSIFSVVNGVLLRPLPYRQPERLVWFLETQPGLTGAPFSAPDFLDFQAQNHTLEQMAALRSFGFNLTGQGEPERLRGSVVSANYFSVLSVAPKLGRALLAGEGLAGAPRVAVLSNSLWQRRFGGDASLLGRTITLQGLVLVVAGVVPGAAIAVALTRVMRSLPFEISPTDPATLAGVTLLLAGGHAAGLRRTCEACRACQSCGGPEV